MRRGSGPSASGYSASGDTDVAGAEWADYYPPEVVDLIMHSVLTTGVGFSLMASDTSYRMARDEGTEISISVSGTAEDDHSLRTAWDALAEGAGVTMPLETAMWGDTFGMLVDRFGVHWMFSIAAPAS